MKALHPEKYLPGFTQQKPRLARLLPSAQFRFKPVETDEPKRYRVLIDLEPNRGWEARGLDWRRHAGETPPFANFPRRWLGLAPEELRAELAAIAHVEPAIDPQSVLPPSTMLTLRLLDLSSSEFIRAVRQRERLLAGEDQQSEPAAVLEQICDQFRDELATLLIVLAEEGALYGEQVVEVGRDGELSESFLEELERHLPFDLELIRKNNAELFRELAEAAERGVLEGDWGSLSLTTDGRLEVRIAEGLEL